MFNKIRTRFKSLFKPRKVISLSSDSKIKLKDLSILDPKKDAYYKLDKRDDVFEVVMYDSKKQIVTITDIAGNELTMSKNLFEYLFFEVMQFTPKTYTSIDKT